MDQATDLTLDQIRRDSKATRQRISRAVNALRAEAGKTMHWPTYVARYPLPLLGAAAIASLMLGRRLARAYAGTRPMADDQQPYSGPASASWHRLGAHIDGLINRILDEVATTIERAVLPAIVGRVETLFSQWGITGAARSHRASRPDDRINHPVEGELP
jgi:hypothetical protein